MIEAEFTLGLRVASRHPIARSALTWTIGLVAIVRVVSGPPTSAQVSAAVVALAGLLAAAAAPPLFVRGGPFEALRWTRGRPLAAVLARLAAAIAIAALGAAAAGRVFGPVSVELLRTYGGAALHAAVIGALAAALAPRAGCAWATVCTVLLVAAGVGAVELDGVVAARSVLLPPGAVLGPAWSGGVGSTALLLGWTGLAFLGMLSLAHRVRPTRVRARGARAGL